MELFTNDDLRIFRLQRLLLGATAVATLSLYTGASSGAEVEMISTGHCAEVRAYPVELADILVIALESQPELLIAQEAVAKARANLIAARSPFLPNLTLALQSERFVPSTVSSPVSVGNVVVGGVTETKTTYGSIGINWNLYSGGRDLAGYRATQADVRSSDAGLSYQLNDTMMSILSAYTDVHQAQLDAGAKFRILALRKIIEERIEVQFRQGLTTNLAIAQAQADVLESSQELYQACRAVADNSAKLAQVVGMHLDPDELYLIGASLPTPDGVAISLNQFEWQKLIQDNPAVVAAKSNVAAAEYRLKQAKASIGPSLSLEGRKDYLGQDADSWRAANHIEPNSYRIGLQIRQPILPMTSEYSAVQSAKSDLRRAQASYRQTFLETEGKYHVAINAKREAEASLNAAKSSLAKANELLGLTQALFAAGRVDQDKVEEAKISVEKASIAITQADARRRVALWLAFGANEPSAFVNQVLSQSGIHRNSESTMLGR